MSKTSYCGNCGRSKDNHTVPEWYNCQKYLIKFHSSKDLPGGVG